ncbi:MAG: 30S ribosomal protein S13 [Nanoarchaeota archaeon]
MTELRGLIRILNADIKGENTLSMGLTRIKGVSHMLSAAVCSILKLDRNRKAGSLTDEEIKQIESCILHPNFPAWLMNRRHDSESNQNKHLTSADLKFQVENDIKMMKKMKSYRGMRHAAGLPVRGQGTKAHFRHGKTVGVTKKAKLGKKG